MALPNELFIPRIEGDDYSLSLTVDQDLSGYTLVLRVEGLADIASSAIAATTLTFPGTLLGTLAAGKFDYKLISLAPSVKTLLVGVVQVYTPDV